MQVCSKNKMQVCSKNRMDTEVVDTPSSISNTNKTVCQKKNNI